MERESSRESAGASKLEIMSASPDIKKRESYRILLNAQAEALTARILLDELRAGHLAMALELLEMRLDTSVLKVNCFAHKVDSAQKTNAIEVLRIVRRYRLRRPRKTEAIIGEPEDSLWKCQAQEKVKEILDGIPDT